MRLPDAGDEGVGLARLLAHVHSQNRRIADAEARGQRADAFFQRTGHRLERIEERHHIEWNDQVADDEERKDADRR